ncbi:YesN/AraC family two-component response regulator [Chryseobacterium defluvii]|uniref:YesN/AraC family two-component response regulator n=1 Tax=Chryseobacterium defluvii TaxID=160396 RepID=A0A840K9N4_9FLAO|nr:AraC family transcriptional regulator [Chryseobacterium defluvii]MBB4805936.1 YesN/AraC family two-component response regulator [Chryseobacterium defluvii]
MKKSLYFFFVLFCFCSFFAQSSKKDEHKISMTSAAIQEKLDIYRKNPGTNLKQNENLLLQLKTESEKQNYDLGILQSSNYLIRLYMAENRNKKIIELVSSLKSTNWDKRYSYLISDTYRMNALALVRLGFYNAGLKDFKTAISYTKTIEDKNKRQYTLGLCYENISVYYVNKQFNNKKYRDSTIYYLNKSLEAYLQVRDNETVPNDFKYGSMAFIDMRLGIFYLEQNNIKGSLELAEKHLFKALSIHENEKYNVSVNHKTMLMNQISWLYLEQEEYEKSIDFAKRAIELERRFPNPYNRVESFEFLANSYMEIGEKEKSKFYMSEYSYLKDSIRIAEKNAADKSFKLLVSESDKIQKKKLAGKIIVVSTISLLVLLFVVFYWKRKNKLIHKKYEELITRIKSEKEAENIFRETQINTDNNGIRLRAGITEETTKTLLQKLIKFEKSGKYLRNEISRSWLSDYLNTNNSYLTEVIKIRSNKNFTDYINGLRIDYITRKLMDEPVYREYKIEYLASESGYGSRQVFVIAFKKETGFTPSYFVEQLKNDSKNGGIQA